MSSVDDDDALIAAALNGSAYAWEKLVRRYENRIYNHGLRLTGNQSDAMDLMQEVFLGVYRNLHRFRGDAQFSSWIFRIAHNKAMDMNRRRNLFKPARSETGPDEDFAAVAADHQQEPDSRLSEQRRNRQIIEMLSSLPFEQRLIVELKIFQSLTFDEIAAMQEISENTAKTRFYAAMKKLRNNMEEPHVLS